MEKIVKIVFAGDAERRTEEKRDYFMQNAQKDAQPMEDVLQLSDYER